MFNAPYLEEEDSVKSELEDEANAALASLGNRSPAADSGPDPIAQLKQQQDDAAKKKAYLGVAGNIFQSLTDRPSGYEIYTGKHSARPDIKGMFGAVSDSVQDPMTQQQKAYAFLKSKRESDQFDSGNDATSADSIAMADQIGGMFPQFADFVKGKSKAQIKEMMPILSQKIRGDTERENARIAAGSRQEARNEAVQNRRDTERFRKEDKADLLEAKLQKQREERTTPYGVANNDDDAKKLKEAHESKKNFDRKINEMIELRTSHNGGSILDREAVNRGAQLSKDLLLEYKNMAKLGVLSQADENIINAIIPADPLEFNSPLAAIQGQDPIMNNLKKFKSDSDSDFQTRIETRVRGGAQSDVQHQGKTPPATKVIGGVSYRKVPGGWEEVPVVGQK